MSAVPPVATPLSGLARIALSDSQFQRIGELVGTAEQSLVAPPAVRPFVAAALAEKTPVLVVTATGREADDLTAELARDGRGQRRAVPVLGDPAARASVAERRHRGPATRGAAPARAPGRSRIYGPDRCGSSSPPCVPWCSPWRPDSEKSSPSRCVVGSEHDFDELVARLVELAYTRVDMVGKRGEFAVRGGILDVFPPTADHPVRIEFWGDEVTELRPFSVADQRSIPELEIDDPSSRRRAGSCCSPTRSGARRETRRGQPGRRRAGRDARQDGRRHPGRGHGSPAAGAAAG